MSREMSKVRAKLQEKHGANYGLVRLVWLCQKYGISPLDERVPEGMKREAWS